MKPEKSSSDGPKIGAKSEVSRVALRLRVVTRSGRAMGPGKAAILEAIERVGSITKAALELEMSYRRVWGLIKEMNNCFAEPLVKTEVGGAEGGKAYLTPVGRDVLSDFRSAESAALRAAESRLKRVRSKLKS